MCYVMLGRSERLQDIFIVCEGEMDMKAIKCDPAALIESKRLERIFEEAEQNSQTAKNSHWKISYVNVRSLNAHHQDVMNDNIITESDIIGLGETWLCQNETVTLGGFCGYFANCGRGKGLAGFSRMPLLGEPDVITSNNYSAIQLKTSNFNIIFLYLSKDYDKHSVFHLLEDWIKENTPTAVIGDINENLLENSKFENFMKAKDFQQMIQRPTFEKGSILDHIYVNKPMRRKNIFTEQTSSYYSDHDVISLYISK